MKNLLVSLVLSLLLCTMIAAQSRKTDKDYDGLRGAVKSVRVETAKLSSKSGQWVEGKRTPQRTVHYDKLGNRTNEAVYTDDEDVFFPSDSPYYPHQRANSRINYHYDTQGNRTESSDFMSPAGDLQTRIRRWVFQVDTEGNRVTEAYYSDPTTKFGPIQGSVLLGAYTHSYDEKGQRTTTTFSNGGTPLYKWIYKRDESGNLAELSKYSGNRQVIREGYQYEFDAKGNWIKRVTSKWVTKNGRSYFEPVEATHRSIMYY